MRFLVDAQLPPLLATTLRARCHVNCEHVSMIGMTRASDRAIFDSARTEDSVVVTKDIDFVYLLQRYGPPPRVLLLAMGNRCNQELFDLVLSHWETILRHFQHGEPLIEIRSGDQG